MFNVAEILKTVNDNYYGVVAIRHCAEDEDYKVILFLGILLIIVGLAGLKF